MKAALFVGVNEPISVEDVTPVPPGPRDVVLRIGASGVCHSDVSMVDGTLPCPVPAILGHESAGTVEAVGSDVTSVKVGDRVISSFIAACGECWYCRHDLPFVCSETMSVHGRSHAHRSDGSELTCIGGLGTMAEMMTVDERLVVPVRSDLPDEQLALIGCGVTTGVGAALNTAKIEPGSSVAVIGCGGVGQAVIQGARIAGAAEIIAVDMNETKLQMAKDFGATASVNAGQADPVGQVMALTGQRGADVAFEVIGLQQTIDQTIAMTRRGGQAILVGVPRMEAMVQVPAFLGLVFQEKTIKGCWYGSSNVQRDVPKLIDLYNKGELKLDELVSRTITLDQVNEAFETMKTGEVARSVISYT